MNSLKNFWMWNAWDIHHHHERDQCWQMMNDAIKWAKARVFVYADSVLCLAKMEQVSGAAETVERQTWRHWYVFTISRCSGNRWRSNWTRVEKIPRFFQDCPFFKRSRKTWYRRTSNRRNQMIFVSMFNDICGNQMIGIASQTLRKSTITRSSSFQDIGRFLVQAQRRHGTEVLTNNNSKKQHTLFSQTSVLRIDEFSNEDKTKVPFTSIENPRTRNSCFRRFILQLSSVSTEQRRTGVLSSTWRMKRKDQMQFLWTVKCWLLWSQKK